MEGDAIFALLSLGLRITGILVCVGKANKLNRNSTGWGFFGFFFPIVAMIWIHCLKPVISWDKNVDLKQKTNENG